MMYPLARLIINHLFTIRGIKHMASVQHPYICRDTQQVDRGHVYRFHSFQRWHVCCFLPSKERKTLGRGCGRLETPVERNETARRESTTANTRGGLANPSSLPMTTPLRNHDQSPQSVGGGLERK